MNRWIPKSSAREADPFKDQALRAPYRRDASPYVQRIRLLWRKMREDIPGRFPAPPPKINDVDAYHSLSIEGYQVSTD